MNKLTGTLLYVQLQSPVAPYVEAGFPPKPKEWKASVAIVDEDVIDAYEEYAKSINAKTSVKKVKVAEFEAKYKCPVPEGASKNVWIVTLRKSTELGKTGKPVPNKFQPRVLEKLPNGNLMDVTATKLPGNGSKGTVSIEVFERNNGTASLYLKNVLVTDMVEYEGSADNYNPGDEFGEDGDAPAAPAPKPAAKPKSKPPAKPAPADDDDSDVPF